MQNATNIQEEKVMIHKKRFLLYLQRNRICETEEILDRRMMIIPEESKKIIEARWGLDGGRYCNTFKLLNKKLGVDNAQSLYVNAEYDLKVSKFAEILSDFEDFDDWNVAVYVGTLSGAVTGKSDFSSVIGKKLLEELSKLNPRECKVIQLLFGLNGEKPKTRNEVGMEFQVSEYRVLQIETKALRKLRHPSHTKEFYIPYQEAPKEKEEELAQNPEVMENLDSMDISFRSYSCLKRAGYQNLRELEHFSFEDLLKIPNLGMQGAKEVEEKIKSILL